MYTSVQHDVHVRSCSFKGKTTGATNRTGTAYLSGVHECTLVQVQFVLRNLYSVLLTIFCGLFSVGLL